MSWPRKAGWALTGLMVALAVARTAHAVDPITWSSLDCGGPASVAAGSYTLGGTIGQHDAGLLAGGAFTLRGGFRLGGQAPLTGVDGDAPTPLVFRFLRSPNPVRFQSRVAFDLPSAGSVRLSFFDITGRAAKRLDLGRLGVGHYERSWRAEDGAGRPLPSGVYYVRLEAGRDRATQKILILR